MTAFGIADAHVRAFVAALDCAVDGLCGALDEAHQLGAYDVPSHRRNADQDDAIIRVGEAQEAVEEYLEHVFTDRYGLDSCVTVEVIG